MKQLWENEEDNKEIKIKEETNKNNISTVSNTNSEDKDIKNDIIIDDIKEINDKINLNGKEEENIEIKNIINEEKVDSEKETEENDIGEESQSPEKAKEEIQKESISGVNPVNKKRRKKKKITN